MPLHVVHAHAHYRSYIVYMYMYMYIYCTILYAPHALIISTYVVCRVRRTVSPHFHRHCPDQCIYELPGLRTQYSETSYRTTGGPVDCSTCSHLHRTVSRPIERPRCKMFSYRCLVQGHPTHSNNQILPEEVEDPRPQCMGSYWNRMSPRSQRHRCTHDACFRVTRTSL